MEKLSPEDISRARELAAEHIVKSRLFERTHISLLDNLTIPYSSRKISDFVTAKVMADFALAYSAAENKRLTKERDALRDENYHLRHAPRGCSFCGELQGHKQTCWTVGTLLALEAAEAKRDRLKGALKRIREFATTEAQSSRDLDAGDAAEWDKVVKMAALRPEGE